MNATKNLLKGSDTLSLYFGDIVQFLLSTFPMTIASVGIAHIGYLSY